jgi:tyrosine-protein kinase Etk/Wzc
MTDSSLPSRFDPGANPAPVSYDPDFNRPLGYPPAPVDDDAIDLRRIWGIIRRNAWVILTCLVLSLVVGWLLTERAVPMYEATASLRITEDKGAVPGLDILQEIGGGGNEVNTELELLRSRTLIGEVLDEFDLRARVTAPRKLLRRDVFRQFAVRTDAPSGDWQVVADGDHFRITDPGAQAVTASAVTGFTLSGLSGSLRSDAALHGPITIELLPREEAITRLSEALRISRPTRDANILVVRYRGADPVLVEAVPNALVRAYIARRVGTRKTGARSTVDFLRVQLDTLQGELTLAEDSLQRFREAEGVVAIEEQATVSVGKLAELQAERNQAAAELQAIEATLADARTRPAVLNGASPYRRLLAFPTLLRNQVISTVLENITTLENERSTLLVRRTEKDPDVIALNDQIAALEDQIASLVGTYTEGLRQQVAAFDRSLTASGTQLATIPAKEVRLAQLTRNTQVLTELSTLLQTRLKEAEIAEAVEDPSAQVVDFAARPTKPVSPRPVLNLALAGLLGLLVSGGIAVGRELFDTKVHNREELQQATGGLPVLGVIPRFEADLTRRIKARTPGRRAGDKNTALVARETPEATVLEAYRALRTSLAFAGVGATPKVILVTSPTPDDGKSTSTANLAASLAQQRQRVLVIDADMRRGSLHRTLGGSRTPGLSEILSGQVEVLDAVQSLAFNDLGRIDLISTGVIPPNPAELLASTRVPDLLEVLEPRYDTILIDTTPVNVVADVLAVARHVDGVVLVARGGRTEKGAIKFAIEQLATVRAPILGTVLNDYDFRRAASYGGEYYRYYYGSGYGETS